MKSSQIILLITLAAIGGISLVRAQENPNFNVDLNPNFAAAERVLDLCDGRFISAEEVAALRGNKIAAATAQYIAQRGSAADVLHSYLDSLKEMAPIKDDLYHIADARKNAEEIRAFMEEIKKKQLWTPGYRNG